MSYWSEIDPPNCPICGSDEISWGTATPPGVWIIECHADGCEVGLTAASADEMLYLWREGKWTFRVTEYDDNGHPIITRRSASS